MNFFKLKSIKTKILFFLIVLAFLLCVLVSSIVYFYLKNNLVNKKIEEINKLNIEQIHDISNLFEKDKIFTKMLGTNLDVKDFLYKPNEKKGFYLLNFFNKYTKEDSKYLAIYLLDKNGVALVSTDDRFLGQDYSFRPYFKEALAGDVFFVDASIGKTSNQFGYYFSYPVKDNEGLVLGVLVVKINNKEIDDSILNSQIAKDSTIMLVDEYGIILTSNRPERFLKSLGKITEKNKEIIKVTDRVIGRDIQELHYDNVQNFIDSGKESGLVEFFDSVDNETEKISVNKIQKTPFFLVSEVALEDINNLIFSTFLIIIFIIVIGILLFSIVFYRFISFFLFPLKQFNLLLESISKGDFSKKIYIKTKDEFGKLGLAFNTMTDNLNDLYKNLDKKVKEKTEEVELNAKELKDQKSAILNILDDVEKEKTKAEELSMIVRDANEPIVSQNLDGIILSWNNGAEKLYGYTADEAIGNSIKLIVPEDKNKEIEDIRNSILSDNEVEHFQTIRKKKDGTLVDISLSVSPVRDKIGKIIGISVITLDITKEKQIDKTKTEFVSLASHQLRTPLSAINWYTEMLLAGDAGKLNEEQEKYLKEVYVGNQRMVALVNALLNVSRLDLGTFAIDPKPINIVEMAKSVLLELKGQILEKKLKINESYQENLPEFKADQNLLRIVFQNLLSNSVKYTPENGEVGISVSITLKDKNFGEKIMGVDSLTITIFDSGMGIPENQKDKMFSKLFRADNARETETEGTGLWLYLVKSIVDKVEGDIWFKSIENKGTTFYVVFPLSGMKKKEGSKNLEQF